MKIPRILVAKAGEAEKGGETADVDKAVKTAVAKAREGVRVKAREVAAEAEQALVNALHTLQADAKSEQKGDVERAKTDVTKNGPTKGASQ